MDVEAFWYRTAEVNLRAADTRQFSPKIKESSDHRGLYVIGEVVDVTGHLVGYNFQQVRVCRGVCCLVDEGLK